MSAVRPALGTHIVAETSIPMKAAVKAVLDRDVVKKEGDNTVSPVSSGRRNVLALNKSVWWTLTKELKYHPYKMVHRQLLKPQDPPRRLHFCNWFMTKTDQHLEGFNWSDESNFHLCGHVNTHTVNQIRLQTQNASCSLVSPCIQRLQTMHCSSAVATYRVASTKS